VRSIQESVKTARATAPQSFAAPTAVDVGNFPTLLRLAVEAASRAIFQAAQEDPDLAGMGTTVTAALVDGRTAYVAHVGDSRCYLLRDGRIYQVSEDHSLVNEQLKAGAITEDEAKHSRFKNIITRSVGFEQQVQVDLMGVEFEAGDHLVICCDGLSNLVDDGEILEIVQASQLDLAPGRLVALANDRGGDDNVTVIVLHAVER
jgi:protein phosphatase